MLYESVHRNVSPKRISADDSNSFYFKHVYEYILCIIQIIVMMYEIIIHFCYV